MVVAPKSTISRRRQVSSGKTVTALPSSQATPLWLLRLGVYQRGISVVTFTLVMAALATYGWTVYCQHSWNEAYRKLILLQRNERQLMTQSEELKQHIAEQAEKPEMGLTPPDPTQVIFLPEPEGSTRSAVSPERASNRTQQLTPMGY